MIIAWKKRVAMQIWDKSGQEDWGGRSDRAKLNSDMKAERFKSRSLPLQIALALFITLFKILMTFISLVDEKKQEESKNI